MAKKKPTRFAGPLNAKVVEALKGVLARAADPFKELETTCREALRAEGLPDDPTEGGVHPFRSHIPPDLRAGVTWYAAAILDALASRRWSLEVGDVRGAEAGAAIYNAVKRHPAKVTTYIDGLAASIASVIALAGDKIIMAENAIFMTHNPSGFCMGRSEDMRKTADILDKVCGTMIGAYSEKSGKGETETWMDAGEAMAAGFVDEVGDEMDMAACARFVPAMEKMGFKRIPQAIKGEKTIPTAREVERLLRSAGFNSKQAKTLLAKGYSGDLRIGDAAEVAPVAL